MTIIVMKNKETKQFLTSSLKLSVLDSSEMQVGSHKVGPKVQALL